MMRSWTAIAVAFTAILAATGCNDYGNTFQVNTGVILAAISPANVNAGGPDLTITLTAAPGNAFVVNTTVTWDQKNIKTCVVTTTAANICAPLNDTGSVISVTAVVPAALTAKAGTHFIQTIQPNNSGAGTNGLSNPIAFFVFPPANPVPAVTSISPNTAAAGSAALSLTITGTNFLLTTDPSGGSQVRWNTTTQTNLSLTNITATQIQATVPAALLATAGAATVTVYNPPAPPPSDCKINCTGFGGGGTSNGSTFTITGAGGTAAIANAAMVEEETPAVSQDGRYVAYTASQNGHSQIFARDTCQGADSSCQPRTLLVSSAPDGTAASDDNHSPSMNSDGRYVAFSSAASNLLADSASSSGRQTYLRDTCFGVSGSCTPTTQLISTDPNGTLVGTEAILPSVSASGRFVAFLAVTPAHSSPAPADKSGVGASNSGLRQVYVRDTCLGAANCTPKTTRISLQPGDGLGSGTSKPAGPAISGSANHVALAAGNTATLFTHSVAIDDGVFLALTKNQR